MKRNVISRVKNWMGMRRRHSMGNDLVPASPVSCPTGSGHGGGGGVGDLSGDASTPTSGVHIARARWIRPWKARRNRRGKKCMTDSGYVEEDLSSSAAVENGADQQAVVDLSAGAMQHQFHAVQGGAGQNIHQFLPPPDEEPIFGNLEELGLTVANSHYVRVSDWRDPDNGNVCFICRARCDPRCDRYSRLRREYCCRTCWEDAGAESARAGYPWFMGRLSRQSAESLLTDMPPGTFLVRMGGEDGHRVVISTRVNARRMFVHNDVRTLIPSGVGVDVPQEVWKMLGDEDFSVNGNKLLVPITMAYAMRNTLLQRWRPSLFGTDASPPQLSPAARHIVKTLMLVRGRFMATHGIWLPTEMIFAILGHIKVEQLGRQTLWGAHLAQSDWFDNLMNYAASAERGEKWNSRFRGVELVQHWWHAMTKPSETLDMVKWRDEVQRRSIR